MATRKPGSSQPSTKKRTSSSPSSNSRRGGKTIKTAIDDFLFDRQSQNHSPQTLRWLTIALDHFVTFLEKQHTLTYLQDLEAVRIRAWLVFLGKGERSVVLHWGEMLSVLCSITSIASVKIPGNWKKSEMLMRITSF